MGNNSSNDSQEMSGSIQSIVQANQIVVFQSSGCPYCIEAVRNLKAAGYAPTVIEATSQQRQQLVQETSSRSVPNIWIKGKYVGGCNDGPEPWMGINKILKGNKMASFLA